MVKQDIGQMPKSQSKAGMGGLEKMPNTSMRVSGEGIGVMPRAAVNTASTADILKSILPQRGMVMSTAADIFRRSSGDDVDALLEGMYRDQFNTYEQFYEPMLLSLEEESKSTRLVDEAQRRAATMEADSKAATQRSLSRTGTSLTPAQRMQMERSRKTNVTIGQSVSVNNARKAQQGIREGAITDLMTSASALQAGSTDALATVSQNKYQRDAAYEAASSGFMGNVLGTVGAIGGAMIGGPAGAAIGGALGGAIGSNMG